MSDRTTAAWRARHARLAGRPGLRHWLTDPGSLTARLQTRGRFSVALLRQQIAQPTPDEAAKLALHRHRRAWIREVALNCDGCPVVFAHTVLPQKPRGPLTRWLARLGTRSLGALLFSHPGFTRGPLRSCRIDHRHPLFPRAIAALGLSEAPPRLLWARRSRFSFGAQEVLVTEVFAPRITDAEIVRPPDNNADSVTGSRSDLGSATGA